MGQGLFSRGDSAASPKRRRAAWLATTGLTAILLSPASLLAQTALAPDTTPQGGSVVGGSSSIAQAPGSTTITQTSQRTAIDWQSFNVGSAARVQFVQPSSAAIALNRVVTPEPSIIAGRIDANGQLVLINQSGVVFTGGSQVNAESIFVSTSNIANSDFMAGHLNFTGAPNPGASIVNNGKLTARQAGLVGLVAPQVANNGVITARLGQVVLAGASAFTLDLYGDRLISLDVTQAVRAVDIGGKTLPALVTNQGLIIADGGTITLTAADADALVTQLIDAGGTLRANSVGAQTGMISLEGVGGNISIAGNLLAQGTAPGTKGGAIQAIATGTVGVGANAVIDASGRAGGGVIALGTTIARTQAGAADSTAPSAAVVTLAPGAVVKADATGQGNGGKIALLSTQATHFSGTISTQGGGQGGNGGTVEISSAGVINLGGTVLDTAINGQAGEIVLDPQTLVVSSTSVTGGSLAGSSGNTFGTDTGPVSYVTPDELASLTGTIVLDATNLLQVASPISLDQAVTGLTLDSGQDVSIDAEISLPGSLEVDAAGSLVIDAPLNAGGISLLDGASGVITIGAAVTGSSYVDLQAGGVSETADGLISTPLLESTAENTGNDVLTGANAITQLGTFTAGDLTLNDTGIGQVTIGGPVSGDAVLLAADTLDLAGDLSITGLLTLEAPAGGVLQAAGSVTAGTLTSGATSIGGDADFNGLNAIGTLGNFTVAGGLAVEDSIPLDIAGSVVAGSAVFDAAALDLNGPVSVSGELSLDATAGDITEGPTGSLAALDLDSDGGTVAGAVSLGGSNNFQDLGDFAATGNIVLNDTGALQIIGLVDTPDELSLGAGGPVSEAAVDLQDEVEVFGRIFAGSLTSIGTIDGAAALGDANQIGTLGNFAASGNILLRNAGLLSIAGLVQAPAGLTLEDDGLLLNGVAVAGSGGIVEIAGGTIVASELDSGGTTINGNVALTNSNSIATLGNFAVVSGDGGDYFELVDSGSLDIAGTVTADTAEFYADTLSLGGSLSTSVFLSLDAGTGGITELAGGGFTTSQFGSNGDTVAGTIDLGGANSFQNLDDLAATGNILLNDTSTFGIEIDGTVATPGQLTLQDAGALTEGDDEETGLIEVGTLASLGTIGGIAELGDPNAIGTLGNFAASGNILLDNTGTLNIAGLLQAPAGLTLEDDSDITELAGGTIAASELDSGGTTIAGNVDLGQTVNTIGTLENFTVGGSDGLIVLDSGSLDVAGTIVAGSATFGAPTLALNGPLSITNVLALEADAGGIAEAGGITAGTLTSGGTTIGSAVSLGNAITIATLGQFAASGDILFQDNTPTLTIDGLVQAPAGLTLENTGGIAEAVGGVIDASELDSGGTAIGGNVELGQSNAIGTLDGFTVASGDDLTVVDSGSLGIAGPVSAGSATFEAGTLGLNGTILATTALTLEAGAGGIGEGEGGSFTTGTLSGATTDGGTVDLGGANFFSTLDNFGASGSILLDDTGGYTIVGLVSTPDALSLEAGGALDEAASGTIAAGTLASIGTIGGGVSLGNGNAIGTLGGFAATGNILLADAGTLNIAGLVAAPAGLTLEGGSDITELAGGVIDASELDSGGTDIAGDVDLGNANTINTLSGFAVGGGILLNDAAPLLIDGAVATPDILTLQDSGAVTETTGGTLDAGTLSTGGSAIGGDVLLGNPNTIATLANFTLGAGDLLDLNDIGTLNITGPVVAPEAVIAAGSIDVQGLISASNALTLAGTSGIAIPGTIDAGALALQVSAGNVDETGGSITTTGALSTGQSSIGNAGISGNAVLDGTNSIAEIGNFTLGGNLSLDNGGALDVIAPVQASTVTLADAGTVSLNAGVTATGGQITLAVDGLQAGEGGSLSALDGTIAISPFSGDDAIDLGGTSIGGLQLSDNLVGELDPSAVISISGGGILTEGAVTFANPLLVFNASGAVTQTGILAGNDIDISGSNLNFDGDLSAAALALATPGNITQPADAVLAVDTLESLGAIGGSVALAGTGNSIFTLTGFTAGQFALDDAAPLTVAGPISAANIFLTDSNAGGIALGSALLAGNGGTIGLTADALSAGDGTSLLAPAGTVAITPYTPGTAVDLGGTAPGLDLGAGLISAAGAGTSLLDIATTGSIAADGDVTDNAGTLALDGNGIGFFGTLDLPASGVLVLTSTDGVATAAGETLTAATLLAGTLIGPVDMNAGANIIGALGPIVVTGTDNDFALNDAIALNVTNPITARNIGLGAPGLTLASELDATGQVSLASSNGITETGAGLILAPTLTSGGNEVTGAVRFDTGNTIATLANFLASGNLSLDDVIGLTLAGNVSAANINLNAAGLDFDGAVTTGRLVLASSAGITQPGGTISAATLTSNASVIAGAADFGAAGNVIATLAPFAASGDLTLNDAGQLTVNGPVNAADIELSAAGIALDGALTTGTLQLASGDGVTEGADAVLNAAVLTTGAGSVTGDAVLNDAGNTIATLGGFTATGGLTLNDQAALGIDGPVSLGGALALLDPNGVTQTGGTITAAALTSDGGSIGGDATFGAAGNAIASLGNFTATGDILLADAGPLDLAGNVDASTGLTLNVAGAIVQNAGIVITPLFSADPTAISLPDANQIGELGNVIASGDVTIAGVGEIGGQLTAADATISSPGNLRLSGNSAINNNFYATAGGEFTQTGTLNADNASLAAGGDIALSGTEQIGDAFDASAGGNFIQSGGRLVAANALITAGTISFRGDSDISGALDVIARANVLHTAGSLDAGTLTGSGDQLALFSAPTDIGTLGSFLLQDSLFSLSNSGDLTITGPVRASAISLSVAGTLTLAGGPDGGLFIKGGISPFNTTIPGPDDSVITVTGGANGSPPAVVQTGTFLINSGANAQAILGNPAEPATLFLTTSPSGIIDFAPFPDGLYAPSIDLILGAGPAGIINGNLVLQHLEISSALSTDLTGTINGITGPSAAAEGSVNPFPQSVFRFNTCPIASINCTILPTETVPAGNPLSGFDITSRKHKRLNRNVVLPGVAARDF